MTTLSMDDVCAAKNKPVIDGSLIKKWLLEMNVANNKETVLIEIANEKRKVAKYIEWLKDVKKGDAERKEIIGELYLNKPLLILINKYTFLLECYDWVLEKERRLQKIKENSDTESLYKMAVGVCEEALHLKINLIANDFNFLEAGIVGNMLKSDMSL